MFGQNEITRPIHFKTQPENVLKVTSIFYTLQGEGPFSGQRAVFVRLTGCHLRCSFCDTYFGQGDNMTFEAILAEARRCVASWHDSILYADTKEIADGCNPFLDPILLVITGGEPMLQRNLFAFIRFAMRAGFRVQIETSGSVLHHAIHNPDNSDYVSCAVVVSPKAADGDFIKPKDAMLQEAMALKFVVSATILPYNRIPQWALDWRKFTRRNIYVSPMNMYLRPPVSEGGNMRERSNKEVVSFWTPGLLDMRENERNHKHAAYLAMKHDLVFSLQAHLYAGLA